MPRPKMIIYALALLLSLGSGLSSLQERPDGRPSNEQPTQSFTKFAAQQMAIDQTASISVGFIKDDSTWARGFGHADLIRSGKQKELKTFAAIIIDPYPCSAGVPKGLGDIFYKFETK